MNEIARLQNCKITRRYPDYKQEFYKKCSKEYVEKNIKKIGEIRVWLKQQISK
jgi:hypothetical protein